MTTKEKSNSKQKALEKLRAWHESREIYDFPKNIGLSVNEKKFREISFRTPDGVSYADAKAEDFIVVEHPINSVHGKKLGDTITYRVWYPGLTGRKRAEQTVRFNLHPGIVGIIKVDDFFICVEAFSFPLQRKMISLPRMFGVTKDVDIKVLAKILLDKEFPFFLNDIKKLNVTQLGNTIYQDPSVRSDETLTLQIELELNKEYTSKEDLAKLIDHKNPELLLHHIFTEEEIKEIFRRHTSTEKTRYIKRIDDYTLRDNASLWALALYFLNS